MCNQSQILTVVACCIGSIPPSNSNIDIIENLGTSDVELVIVGFTINFGVTICELRDSDLDLKEIFLNNHKNNITLKDFKRIMNYNQKGFCYIRCLELDDQETMTGVVQEHFSQKLYECETNKLSPLKTEIFSGGMRFAEWYSLMETNFYLVNNYDIYYKIGNKKRDKNYVYAIRLAKQIIRNSEFPTKQLILSYNHIESAEGKTIETLDIEVEMILGPYMHYFENSDDF